MTKNQLILSFYCIVLSITSGNISGEDSFNCDGALEALEEIQRQQLALTPKDSPTTLLELEDQLERKKAHLTLIRGMQKINKEYRNLKNLLKERADAPPHTKDELLPLADNLLKHHQTVQRVSTANQILTIFSDTFGDESLKELLLGQGPITPSKIHDFLIGECKSSNSCDSELKTLLSGDPFANGMAGLLSTVADNFECDTPQNSPRCQREKVVNFRKNIYDYQDELLKNIHLPPSEVQGNFASNERKTIERKREELAECMENCKEKITGLVGALKSYREKVASLERASNDRASKAWSVLKDFHKDADLIHMEEELGADVNSHLIERFVRADESGRTDLKSLLSPSELSVATMKSTRKELLDNLVPDSYTQSREELRQQFDELAPERLKDFFANTQEGQNNRLQQFNNHLNFLLEGADEDFLTMDSDGRVNLNEEKFFNHLKNLSETDSAELDKRIDETLEKTREEFSSLSKAVNAIKKGSAYQQGEKMKNYIVNRLQRRCPESPDSSNVTCNLFTGPDGNKEIQILGEDWSGILAVMENPQDPEHIRTFHKICKDSSHQYLDACRFVNREYRRRYPAGTVEDVIKRTKRETFIYDRQGRITDRILHDNSGGELFAQGFFYALNNPQNLETLMMALTQNSWEDQLNDAVERGKQNQTLHLQYQEYQDYAEERWVEDWFNYLNPNFSPAP